MRALASSFSRRTSSGERCGGPPAAGSGAGALLLVSARLSDRRYGSSPSC